MKSGHIDDMFKVLENLGESPSGRVQLVEDPNTEKTYVKKEIYTQNFKSKHLSELDKTFKKVSKLDNNNYLIKIWFGYKNMNNLYILMKYYSEGNLCSFIKKNKELQDVHITLKIMLDLTNGISILHSLGVPHLNLRPSNILKNGDYFVLSDFRLSSHTISKEKIIDLGTLQYQAPEIFKGEYAFSSDIWSLGIIFYEMISGETPFVGETDFDIKACISIDDPKVLTGFEPKICEMVMRMLYKEPEKRPDLKTLLEIIKDVQRSKFQTIDHTKKIRNLMGLKCVDIPRIIEDCFREDTKIIELQLNYNNIGDFGAQLLGEMLQKNKILQFLSLADNKIGDEGAIAIANALKVNKTLVSLILKFNQIKNHGAKELGNAIKQNKTLREIDLDNNLIEYFGAKHLSVCLMVNTTLTRASIDLFKLGEDGRIIWNTVCKIKNIKPIVDTY